MQTVCFSFIMIFGKLVISMEADYSAEWANLTPEEKKRKLYEKQKVLLDTFLEHGAISRQQYEKSLGDLSEKMGYKGE